MVAKRTRMEITLMCSEHSAHSVDSGLEESGHSNLEVSLGNGEMGNGVEVDNEVDFPICSKKTKQYYHQQ